ncbi:Octicosapeptide/Phox/Bem1p family protein [Striga hermonthica]|uniref:Octicosapeptide/Phox/Bem1p family protein n=1 Tax=Striga hermonthica TaxID=68872 RepID=A0A9N7MCT8_STRHE|nr:Octicosapeptide/Phox/Bem1p family protein [Striga hermonthica]
MDNYSYNSSYPESGDSSPRFREIEFENPSPWEDSQGGGQPPAPPVMKSVTGAPAQGYYAVQRMPPELYHQQQQQQQIYNMVPQAAAAPPPPPPQGAAGYSDGFGMVAQAGYAQVVYDGSIGRQVLYAAPGGVMGASPVPVQVGGVGMDMHIRQGGGMGPENAGKGVAKVTQASV